MLTFGSKGEHFIFKKVLRRVWIIA